MLTMFGLRVALCAGRCTVQGRKTRIGYDDLRTDILMLQEIEPWRGIRAKVVVPLLQTKCRSVPASVLA